MRFNNEDYLKAFPREERAAVVENKTIVKDEPGDVFDDPEPAELESVGGEEIGDE